MDPSAERPILRSPCSNSKGVQRWHCRLRQSSMLEDAYTRRLREQLIARVLDGALGEVPRLGQSTMLLVDQHEVLGHTPVSMLSPQVG